MRHAACMESLLRLKMKSYKEQSKENMTLIAEG